MAAPFRELLSILCVTIANLVNHGAARSVSLGQYPFDAEQLKTYKIAPMGSQRCFEELGCFETGGAFHHPFYRPISLLPDAREVINTRFLLHTRQNLEKAQVFGWNSSLADWEKSVFDRTLKTKMIVHGWLDTQFLGRWMAQMKDAFLKRDAYNVIIVDWQGGNGLPYTQAVSNTRVVGAEMALLIKKLGKVFGVKPESFHLLGHSLGGQIVGYAGKRTENLGRITAMDPAEPLFQKMPPEVHTNPNDALFVEAVHTDALSFITHMGLGMNDPVGHVDFYPNGGEFMPGCNIADRFRRFITGGVVEGVRDVVACNHVKAIEYVIDAIGTPGNCRHVAHQCENYDLFNEGKCASCGENGERCASMDIDDTNTYERFKQANTSIKMYLNTAPRPPFCLFHYQVQLKMMLPSNGRTKVSGIYYLTLHGSKGSVETQLNPKTVTMHPGAQHSFLATTPVDIGELKSYGFRWISSSFIFTPNMYLDFVQVTPMSSLDSKYDRVQYRLCVKDAKNGVSSKKMVNLKPCD